MKNTNIIKWKYIKIKRALNFQGPLWCLPIAPNIRKLDTKYFVTQSLSKDYVKFHKEKPHLTWCNFVL